MSRVELFQLRDEAAGHCHGCDRAVQFNGSGVRCMAKGVSGGFVGFSTGTCPQGKWDHSRTHEAVRRFWQDRPAPAERKPRGKGPSASRARRSSANRSRRPLPPIPREKWGAGLEPYLAQQTDADRGLGDTLARLHDAKPPGADFPADAVLIQITHPCTCATRVRKANELYPSCQPAK